MSAAAPVPDVCHCLAELDQGYRALMRGDEQAAMELFESVRLCIHETPCARHMQAEMALERLVETFQLDGSRSASGSGRDKLLTERDER